MSTENASVLEFFPAPTSSPWGKVQHSTQIAPGIYGVSTSSHGGIHLSPARIGEMQRILDPSIVEPFTGDWAWWEEDDDWIFPYITFGHEIVALNADKANSVKGAVAYLKLKAGRGDGEAKRAMTAFQKRGIITLLGNATV